jgi:type VI secretion system protein ImpH
MQSRSAVALEQIIEDYFEVPVEIQQFTGAWYGLDAATQCAMTETETPSRQVGVGAVVGDAVWDRQARVRIRLGPLSMERYCDFLPEASGYKALRGLTRFFSSDCLEFELQLVLDRGQAPGTELDFEATNPVRLGWVSWLTTAPLGIDPDDTILTL